MNVIFEARVLPSGEQVLIPRAPRPRTCYRLDGVPKKAYDTRAQARRARTKHDTIYRCGTCGHFHLATDTRERRRARYAHAA